MSVESGSRLRLRDGARIDRVDDLSEEVRDQIRSGSIDGDLSPDAAVLSRPGARASVVQIDADTADLLATFDRGATVAEAVLKLARAREIDPEDLLEASLPAVDRLVYRGYLVDADAPPTRLGYSVGDTLADSRGDTGGDDEGDVGAGWRIARVLSRLEDSEVHLVCREGEWGVLKVSTPERSFGRPDHESDILRFLGDSGQEESAEERVTPRLLDRGVEDEDRQWIVLEFCAGVDLRTAATGIRKRLSLGGDRSDLVRLCRTTAAAFAELHRRGVVHGDVHPGNVLVAGKNDETRVYLVDLGCARRLDRSSAASSRPGVDFFREPEQVTAALAGEASPEASVAGEQYAVAVVLFSLVTGHPYLDFAIDVDELRRQIAELPPRSFEEIGVEPWPELESVLGRALSKQPSDRFDSMDDFVVALDSIGPPESSQPRRSSALDRAAARTLRRAGLGGAWLSATESGTDTIPSSIFFGSAGLAWSLLHTAVRRGDPETLALADVWATRALRSVAAKADEADESKDSKTPHGGPPELPTAPLHSVAGIYETLACIAWARGDFGLFVRRADDFLQASKVEVPATPAEDPELDLDLALGRPGSLISAAHLLDRARSPVPKATYDELLAFGDGWLDELWQRLDRRPKIEGAAAWLGLAHGWGGALYATLVWCRAAGRDLPAGFDPRLEELATEGVPHGRGLRWAWNRPRTDSMAGWCHGSAGYVLLFSAVSRLPGFERFERCADAAAWDVWDRFVVSPAQFSHLCCGLAGQAWSLLVRARDTGEVVWRQRAEAVAQSAARRDQFVTRSGSGKPFQGALFKGSGSLPALAADLERPDFAVLPWLEDVEPPSRV